MREPLPGWDHRGVLLTPSTIQVVNVGEWWRVSLIGMVSGESTAPRIAAEDAARALAADIVAALGGSVTWPGEVATTSHGVWRILCGGCQAVVRVTGRLGAIDCPSCRQPIISREAPDA